MLWRQIFFSPNFSHALVQIWHAYIWIWVKAIRNWFFFLPPVHWENEVEIKVILLPVNIQPSPIPHQALPPFYCLVGTVLYIAFSPFLLCIFHLPASSKLIKNAPIRTFATRARRKSSVHFVCYIISYNFPARMCTFSMNCCRYYSKTLLFLSVLLR